MASIRVGLGFDSHALAEGRALILGGVHAVLRERGVRRPDDADGTD